MQSPPFCFASLVVAAFNAEKTVCHGINTIFHSLIQLEKEGFASLHGWKKEPATFI